MTNGTLNYCIQIKLKYTLQNDDMLRLFREEFKMFKIRITKQGFIVLRESSKKNLLILIRLIEKHGLISFYARTRFAFFKYCFFNNITYSEFLLIKTNSILFVRPDLKTSRNTKELAGMRNARQYINIPGEQLEPFSRKQILDQKHFGNWLCGFIEGESCFSIRENGNHSFSIAQKDDIELIEAIKLFFGLPNKIQLRPLNVYLIETYSSASKKRILDFINMPEQVGLLGEKKLQKEKFEAAENALPNPGFQK
jgi:hypothetical protein